MKVYISTNFEQPANCFEGLPEKKKIINLVKGLTSNTTVELIKDVFLISDTIDCIEIDKKTDCCLLFHTKTNDKVKDAFNFKKKGKHEQGRVGLYAPVFSILLDSKKNQQEMLSEIIGILGFTKDEIEEKDILEAKLEFLHLCLTPEGLTPEGLKDEWNAKNEYSALQNVKDEGPLGENYIKALRVLRNKLL